jgi:predicted 3-demethylubiquinone-9 3-methyltransferase (glyoxalase superfamily)
MDTAGVQHDFTFAPSASFFVSCESESEVDRVFTALSEGGSVRTYYGVLDRARSAATSYSLVLASRLPIAPCRRSRHS